MKGSVQQLPIGWSIVIAAIILAVTLAFLLRTRTEQFTFGPITTTIEIDRFTGSRCINYSGDLAGMPACRPALRFDPVK